MANISMREKTYFRERREGKTAEASNCCCLNSSEVKWEELLMVKSLCLFIVLHLSSYSTERSASSCT